MEPDEDQHSPTSPPHRRPPLTNARSVSANESSAFGVKLHAFSALYSVSLGDALTALPLRSSARCAY